MLTTGLVFDLKRIFSGRTLKKTTKFLGNKHWKAQAIPWANGKNISDVLPSMEKVDGGDGGVPQEYEFSRVFGPNDDNQRLFAELQVDSGAPWGSLGVLPIYLAAPHRVKPMVQRAGCPKRYVGNVWNACFAGHATGDQ